MGDLAARMSDALCNCFGQADAFLNTFLDIGKSCDFSSKLKSAAIKVKFYTDIGPHVAGHAFVCVLEHKVIRICQAFYDDKVPFGLTHTLNEDESREVMQSLKSFKTAVALFKRIIPQLDTMFDKDDVIQVDIECIKW